MRAIPQRPLIWIVLALALALLLLLGLSCRWRRQGPQLPPPVTQVVEAAAKVPGWPTRRYVALGASDTQGGGASHPERGYVSLLFARLAATGGRWELYNRGRGGAQVDDLVRRQLPEALSVAPDVVTLWTGGNDVLKGGSAEAFEVALDTMLQRLRTETEAVVVIANLPRMEAQPFAESKSRTERQRLRERSQAFNAVIESVAARHGVPVVDLRGGTLMYDPANFSADGFHPNDAGYAAMAERFWAVLEGEWLKAAVN